MRKIVNRSDMEPAAPIVPFMNLPFTTNPDEISAAVVGVPTDIGTPLQVGSRLGPQAMRIRSTRLRSFHPTHGFSPFERCSIADMGDCPIYPSDLSKTLSMIESFYRPLASANLRVVSLGGDHLITLPVLRALAADAPVGLVHFDAHNDTGDRSADGDKYASSTPFYWAVEEGLVDPGRVVQIGIRGPVRNYDKKEWALDRGMRIIAMDEFHDMGVRKVVEETRRIVETGPVYVTFDMDGIDPAFAPGTGCPVIGGLTTYESLRILRGLKGLDVIGGDVTEVSPPHDVNDMTALVGATLAYEILCLTADAVT